MTTPAAIFYEANAGTGKTYTLTGFILEAVSRGMSLQRICALTFTDKAANEMMERLRGKVREEILNGKLEASQMQLASRCFIGTIHAFCMQLLQRYAAEVNLPPLFEIDPQEDRFAALFEDRWDAYLSKLLVSSSPLEQGMIRSLGVSALRSLADTMVQLRKEPQIPDRIDNQEFVKNLMDSMAKSRKGTWREFVRRILPDYQLHRGVLSAVAQRNLKGSPEGTRIKDLLACKTEEIYRAAGVLQSGFVKPFLSEYHGAGNVRYDDLLVFARDLLVQPEIRKEMKERYDLVLVDEMQDTDAIQYEIILNLCERKDRNQNFSLREILEGRAKFELEPGKLFVVGDPKQSIYGFRNADLSAYEAIKSVLQNAGAEIRPLTANYRACPNLVEYSNALASRLFPRMKPQDSTSALQDLCKSESLQDCLQLVRIFSPDHDKTHLKILSEANWVASRIKQEVESGRASYKDFGVLLRKLVNAHLYVDALTAQGIPVIIEGERFFYRSQEVIDFVNLLKCIVDPMDELALAGMLRSPVFGMTDNEIASFFMIYRSNHRQIPEALSAALTESRRSSRLMLMDRVFEIRRQMHLLSPASLIDLTFKNLPVLAVAGNAYGAYRSSIAPLNLLRIRRLAIDSEQDPQFNLFHFVSTLSEYAREGKERSQEPLADEGLDAVRMMSIHNSKGLDFPIVIVPLTDYQIRQSGWAFTDVVHDWSSGLTGLKISGITESNYLRLKYENAVLTPIKGQKPLDLEEEEKRVLYVAATRAKKKLCFCCLEDGSGKQILELLKDVAVFMTISEEPSSAQLIQLATEQKPDFQSLDPVVEQWKKVEELSAIRSAPELGSITREAEKLERGNEETAEIEAAAKRSGSTLVGLLCHGVLERLDFQHPDHFEKLLYAEKGKYARTFSRAQIEGAVLSSREILEQFLTSEASKWLKSIEVIGREVPVLHLNPVTRKILSGKIDLLAKEKERYWIVDYKSDIKITDEMMRRYSQQMRLYAEALSASTTTSPACRLILLRTGKIIDCQNQ